MESELATTQRQRLEEGWTDHADAIEPLDDDIVPSRSLHIEPKAGRSPWWREEGWLQKLAESKEAKVVKQGVSEGDLALPEPKQEALTPETQPVSEVA